MSNLKYRSLLDGLCKITGLANPEKLHASANLTINEVSFMLAPGANDNPDSLLIFCNYGVPPQELLGEALLQLLVANLELFPPGGPRFVLNPLASEVILAVDISLRNATSENLLELLECFAKQAKDWQKHYFLIESPVEKKTTYAPLDEALTRLGRGRNVLQKVL